MTVFGLRHRLVASYGGFVRGFLHIPDKRIQLNPSFEPGAWMDVLVSHMARGTRNATRSFAKIKTNQKVAAKANGTQRAEVAGIASMIFDAAVQPEHVIGETLRRATPDSDRTNPRRAAAPFATDQLISHGDTVYTAFKSCQMTRTV